MSIAYKFICSNCGVFWISNRSFEKCKCCGTQNDAYGTWEEESDSDDD